MPKAALAFIGSSERAATTGGLGTGGDVSAGTAKAAAPLQHQIQATTDAYVANRAVSVVMDRLSCAGILRRRKSPPCQSTA
jgi:hypothetical protein